MTTDHISPAGSIKLDSPAGRYLVEHGVERADFNSYGSRRGNHEVMVRGTFANVRLRNQLVPGSEGTWTAHLPDGEETTIFAAAERYLAEGTPTIVLAGKEYGSGSSRDWAAKGPNLLGVRAVIAESYERIHRSNLLMMGILPLQYLPGESLASLGLTGREEFSVTGVENGEAREVTVDRGRHLVPRDPPTRHPTRARVRPPRRDPPVRAAAVAGRLSRGRDPPAGRPGRREADERNETSWGIDPVPERLRVLSGLDLGLLWGNLGVSLLVVVAGAILVPALSLPSALVAIVVGCLVGNLMLAVAGLIGAQARVPAMTLMRAPLGSRGSFLPTVINVVQCLGWTVFELLVIATAAAALSDELVGVDARWMWTLVFGAAALAMGLLGPIGVVRTVLRRVAVWVVPVAIVYLTWWALTGGGPRGGVG